MIITIGLNGYVFYSEALDGETDRFFILILIITFLQNVVSPLSAQLSSRIYINGVSTLKKGFISWDYIDSFEFSHEKEIIILTMKDKKKSKLTFEYNSSDKESIYSFFASKKLLIREIAAHEEDELESEKMDNTEVDVEKPDTPIVTPLT